MIHPANPDAEVCVYANGKKLIERKTITRAIQNGPQVTREVETNIIAVPDADIIIGGSVPPDYLLEGEALHVTVLLNMQLAAQHFIDARALAASGNKWRVEGRYHWRPDRMVVFQKFAFTEAAEEPSSTGRASPDRSFLCVMVQRALITVPQCWPEQGAWSLEPLPDGVVIEDKARITFREPEDLARPSSATAYAVTYPYPTSQTLHYRFVYRSRTSQIVDDDVANLDADLLAPRAAREAVRKLQLEVKRLKGEDTAEKKVESSGDEAVKAATKTGSTEDKPSKAAIDDKKQGVSS